MIITYSRKNSSLHKLISLIFATFKIFSFETILKTWSISTESHCEFFPDWPGFSRAQRTIVYVGVWACMKVKFSFLISWMGLLVFCYRGERRRFRGFVMHIERKVQPFKSLFARDTSVARLLPLPSPSLLDIVNPAPDYSKQPKRRISVAPRFKCPSRLRRGIV